MGGAIFGGALQGFSEEANKRKKAGKSGILRHKDSPMADPIEYRKGGRVKKTGFAKVHKGEVVVPAKKRARRSRGKRR